MSALALTTWLQAAPFRASLRRSSRRPRRGPWHRTAQRLRRRNAIVTVLVRPIPPRAVDAGPRGDVCPATMQFLMSCEGPRIKSATCCHRCRTQFGIPRVAIMGILMFSPPGASSSMVSKEHSMNITSPQADTATTCTPRRVRMERTTKLPRELSRPAVGGSMAREYGGTSND